MMMEYTTPPSYATTTVNVGGITSEDKIVFAGADNVAEHTETEQDEEVDWPEPTVVRYHWKGIVDGKPAEAELAGPLGKRLDRVDIMGELTWIYQEPCERCGWHSTVYIYQVCCAVTYCGGSVALTVITVRAEVDSEAQDWGRDCGGGGCCIHGGYFHLLGRCGVDVFWYNKDCIGTQVAARTVVYA